MNDKEYFAANKRPECRVEDCYECSYFDHDGNCTADDKILGCDFCRTAYSDERLNKDNDLSFCSIGKCSNGYSAFIGSSAMYCPPVAIIVQKWNEQLQRNQDMCHFTPKYCPMCGRLIAENEPYLHSADRKNKNTV